jgi:Lrp/AsnC family leucine-responsive transcriptional regulator
MRDLDETDMTILEMLSENARASYSEIGEAVDLSAPAVSDRVTRLEEAGVIQGFTLDVDHSQLQGGVPLLVEVRVSPGHSDDVRAAIDEADAVEHVFETAEGDVVFHARIPRRGVRDLLDDIAAGEAVEGYEVSMLTDVDWTPTVSGSGFALECAECGNTVSSEGQASRLGDSVYHFCCLTCQNRFEQRHERLENTA